MNFAKKRLPGPFIWKDHLLHVLNHLARASYMSRCNFFRRQYVQFAPDLRFLLFANDLR